MLDRDGALQFDARDAACPPSAAAAHSRPALPRARTQIDALTRLALTLPPPEDGPPADDKADAAPVAAAADGAGPGAQMQILTRARSAAASLRCQGGVSAVRSSGLTTSAHPRAGTANGARSPLRGGDSGSGTRHPRVWVRFESPVTTVRGLAPPQSDVKSLYYGALQIGTLQADSELPLERSP